MSSSRRKYRFLLTLLLLALSIIFIISRYYPKLEHVKVYYGYDDREPYYNESEIKTLTGIYEGQAFFSVAPKKLNNFAKDPWVEKLRVVRYWPDTTIIIVWERKPTIVYHQTQDAKIVYALDGTMLPNVKKMQEENLISLNGWGRASLEEALKLIKLLVEFGPTMLYYSPSGFDITLNYSQLFTPSLEILKKHWGAFSSEHYRYKEAQNSNTKPPVIAIYEWGISVQ